MSVRVFCGFLDKEPKENTKEPLEKDTEKETELKPEEKAPVYRSVGKIEPDVAKVSKDEPSEKSADKAPEDKAPKATEKGPKTMERSADKAPEDKAPKVDAKDPTKKISLNSVKEKVSEITSKKSAESKDEKGLASSADIKKFANMSKNMASKAISKAKNFQDKNIEAGMSNIGR